MTKSRDTFEHLEKESSILMLSIGPLACHNHRHLFEGFIRRGVNYLQSYKSLLLVAYILKNMTWVRTLTIKEKRMGQRHLASPLGDITWPGPTKEMVIS